MTFNAFNHRLGQTQGRIAPSGFVPSGTFALVLGSDVIGDIHDFNIGDRVEAQQTVDLTAENFVGATVRLRNATSVPTGVNWEASLTVDGVKYARMVVEPGRTRDRADMAANVSKLSGPHVLGLRLELVAV